MPVAIAPVDWQVRSVRFQFFLQCRDELPILRIDRTDAAEQFVMMGDLQHPLARHVAAPQNVFEEGYDIIHPLGPAEGNDQDCIVLMTESVTVVHFGCRLFRWWVPAR